MYYERMELKDGALSTNYVKLYIPRLSLDSILSKKIDQVRQLFAKLKSDKTLFSKLRWRERTDPLGFITADGYARNTMSSLRFLTDLEIQEFEIMANSTEDPVSLQDKSRTYQLVTRYDYFDAEPRELILVEETEADNIIRLMKTSQDVDIFINKLELIHKVALRNFKSNNFKIDRALSGNLVIENGYLYAVRNQNQRSRLTLHHSYDKASFD